MYDYIYIHTVMSLCLSLMWRLSLSRVESVKYVCLFYVAILENVWHKCLAQVLHKWTRQQLSDMQQTQIDTSFIPPSIKYIHYMDMYIYIHIQLINIHVYIHKHTYIRTYIYVYMHRNLQNSDWLSSVVIRWGGRRGGNRGSNSGVLATLCVSYLLKTCKYILHRCVLY